MNKGCLIFHVGIVIKLVAITKVSSLAISMCDVILGTTQLVSTLMQSSLCVGKVFLSVGLS